MRPPLPDDPAGVLHGEPEHDEGERRLGHAVVLAQVVLHSLRQQRRVRDLVVYFYIHLNIIIFVKLREREGQRVDLGRSLKGHL